MFAAGQQPEKTGLAGFDFRQASQRGAVGVGGYDFRQKAQQQPMGVQAQSAMAPAQPANPRAGLREQFTKMYQEAQDDTPESEQAQAEIVAEAYAQGVPLSGLGMDILRKSQAAYTLPEPRQAVAPAMVERDASGKPIAATDYGKKFMKSREEMFMKDRSFAKRRMDQNPRRFTL
jgi:hypothetical protein